MIGETLIWRIDEKEDPLSSEFPRYDGDRDVPQSERCAACSKCCLHMPGGFVPSDLEPGFDERAEELLRSGLYSIDWWEDDQRIYFLRPATVDRKGAIFDPSWGGVCALLGPKGCTLDRAHRPTVCKALVPDAKGCHSGMSKEQMVAEWQGDYSARLVALGNKVASPR